MKFPIPYIPGIGIPGVPFLGMGQDLFRQPLDPVASTATATAAASQGRSNTSFFATAVAAGVTTWLVTRLLDRVIFNRKR